MRDRPTGIAERDLVRVLADGWGIRAMALRYAPVGGGSYHWVVTGDQREQRLGAEPAGQRRDVGPARGQIMLVDWDTVGLARPERDLWMLASETGDELSRYTELTGRPVDTTALELYRLRWALDDIACFVRDLRAPHRRTADTEHACRSLELSIAQIA